MTGALRMPAGNTRTPVGGADTRNGPELECVECGVVITGPIIRVKGGDYDETCDAERLRRDAEWHGIECEKYKDIVLHHRQPVGPCRWCRRTVHGAPYCSDHCEHEADKAKRRVVARSRASATAVIASSPRPAPTPGTAPARAAKPPTGSGIA